jgi:superfamily II DNA/RNA helicase
MGRSPRCLVLEPTRELAKQVTNHFLSIKSRFLSISTLYGGKEYSKQELSLKRGSHIVVGTPGRIILPGQRCPPRLMISRCRAAAVSKKKLPRRCRAAMV